MVRKTALGSQHQSVHQKPRGRNLAFAHLNWVRLVSQGEKGGQLLTKL